MRNTFESTVQYYDLYRNFAFFDLGFGLSQSKLKCKGVYGSPVHFFETYLQFIIIETYKGGQIFNGGKVLI